MHEVHYYVSGWELAARLGAGTLLGFAIGFERQLRHRAAGLQTSTLIAVGATLYATIAPSFGAENDLRIIANIVTGVGFLAGGVIVKDGMTISGLNTAATMWAAAAVGALAGVGLFYAAGIGAVVILCLNAAMGPLAGFIDRRATNRQNERE